VDEFQGTDPLQAEIMLLLASDPIEPEKGAVSPGWGHLIPRPGALFVVGDPKQSIYRFRRADIQLYGLVKERFRAFGEVVQLTTNFRSRPAIGDVVNELFSTSGFFPSVQTAEQAAFEPLNTRPPIEPVPAEGVFDYHIQPP
jgi:ATP-dependent helicase/nuclease subunit A